MDGGGHLFKKIKAIQNKVAQRRLNRLKESRKSVYIENNIISKIKKEFTPEQIEAAKKEIQEKAIIENRNTKWIRLFKLIIIILLCYLLFTWLLMK